MAPIKVHDREITLERFTLVKAMRVITLLGVIQKQIPEINRLMSEFKREYRQNNVIELDRVQAKMQYGPRPLLDEEGDPIMVRDDKGEETNEVLTIPSPIDRMTEEDWQRSGQVLRLRQSPSTTEMLMAIFPVAYEHAEQPVQRLLALIAMKNDDVAKYVKDGSIWDKVDEFATDVIGPAYLEEVMELAVAAGETIDGQVMTKAKGLGDRVGNLLRLIGMGPTKTESKLETSPTSSEPPEKPNTDSASPSQDISPGPTPTESSDSPGTPSMRSDESLTATA